MNKTAFWTLVVSSVILTLEIVFIAVYLAMNPLKVTSILGINSEGAEISAENAAYLEQMPDSMLDLDYIYNGLTDPDDKTIYKIMEKHLEHHDSYLYSAAADGGAFYMDTDHVGNLFYGIIDSRPDIFWAYSSIYVNYGVNDAVTSIEPRYKYSVEESLKIQSIIDETSDSIMSQINEMSDYDKAYYLARWVTEATTYTKDEANELQNMSSVFLGEKSCCMSYSTAFAYLCHKAEIPAVVITGDGNEEDHAWNAFRVDNRTIWCDLTWADSNDEWNDTWFDVSPFAFGQYHTPEYENAPQPMVVMLQLS